MRFPRAPAHQAEPFLEQRSEPAPAKAEVERIVGRSRKRPCKSFHYDSRDQLRTHLADLMAAYHIARRLKTLSDSHLRIHRQNLNVRAGPVHRQTALSNDGTEHRVRSTATSRYSHGFVSGCLFRRSTIGNRLELAPANAAICPLHRPHSAD